MEVAAEEFESCAFAFDAILVSFIVRHSFWLFFCAIGILPKTVKRMSHFFSRFRLSVARVQKWVSSRDYVPLHFVLIKDKIGKSKTITIITNQKS